MASSSIGMPASVFPRRTARRPRSTSTNATDCGSRVPLQHAAGPLQMLLGLVEVALVGQDLADVAIGEGDVGRPAGALAARARLAIKLDRVVPTAIEVGEHAEVVEHDQLVLGIAELLVDLERPPRMRGLIWAAGLDERPVERVQGMRERAELADRFCLRDRLAARRDRLRPPALAVPDPAESRAHPGSPRRCLVPGPRARGSEIRGSAIARRPSALRCARPHRRGDRTTAPARSGRRAGAGAPRSAPGWPRPARRRTAAPRRAAPRRWPAPARRPPARTRGRSRSRADTAAPRRHGRTARWRAARPASRSGAPSRNRARARNGATSTAGSASGSRPWSSSSRSPTAVVQLAPQLERQARIGHLLQRGPAEAHVAVGLAREHLRQPVPEALVGKRHVGRDHIRSGDGDGSSARAPRPGGRSRRRAGPGRRCAPSWRRRRCREARRGCPRRRRRAGRAGTRGCPGAIGRQLQHVRG